jgi:hypothetical protein
MEQVTNFDYVGCQLGRNINYDLQNKLQRFIYVDQSDSHYLTYLCKRQS